MKRYLFSALAVLVAASAFAFAAPAAPISRVSSPTPFGGIQPTSPWYAYDAALRNAHLHVIGSVRPTSPWYAYDAALRKAERKRQQYTVKSVQPTSPWYAYDAALRKAQLQRL